MPVSAQIPLKQLRYLSRVVELGSISRASHDLHVAQTALGLQVRALEDSLGATLLLRHPKGVEATDLGKFVYGQSRQVLRAVGLLVAEVQRHLDEAPRDTWLGLTPNVMAAIGPAPF